MNFNVNWVDLVIFIILLYFFIDSFRHNFFVILIEFVSFLSSLLLGFRFYDVVAQKLMMYFPLPTFMSRSVSFFLVVTLSETILAALMIVVYKRIPIKVILFKPLRFVKFILGLADGLLLTTFLMLLALSFPVPSYVKDTINQSMIGSRIYGKVSSFEKDLKNIFGGVIEEGINLVTVNPGSTKRISLPLAKNELTVDAENETAMINLINLERKKVGTGELRLREELTDIARDYAKDMWQRGYFSHYSPEGEDVSDRLTMKNISYNIVGENLALAPTLLVAHTGLMNSEGHRRNILDPIYKRVAVGVIDNGIQGKIFVQIFSD